jgi:DNA polymerase-3 subunit alpha (Gram-positive type)
VYENQNEEVIKGLVDFYDYLEIQPLGNNQYMIGNTAKNGKTVESIEDLKVLNKKIVDLGEKYNKPVVATCDCHFMDPEDEIYRRFVQFGNGFEDVDNQPPLYFRTTDEMLAEFDYLGKEKAKEIVVTNTNMIADMIEDILPVPADTFPPKMENADEDLRRICYGKANEIYGDPLPPVVQQRLDYELNNIIGHGYAVLYIIAQKLVWDSNDHGYIVGSRGSVGSSFAATMAGITEVNPLDPHYICPNCKYSDFDSDVVVNAKLDGISGFDLPDAECPVCGAKLNKNGQSIPFQTFLGFDGDKEPDIDLNFSGEDQQRAHKYCETLFGKGYVFKAGTVSTLQDKTVFGYILKYCEKKGITMRNAEKKRIVAGCVGIKRSTGQHPGGLMVVPSDNNILNFTPVQRPANDFDSDVTTTHFDYHSISGRLLKLDMLGHDVPTILRMYLDLTGYDPLQVPLGDKDTISLFVKPDALGVTREDIDCETGSLGLPEFGTKFARNMLIETQPTTFSDLVRLSGLSHGTDVWAGNAQVLIKEGIATLKEVIPTRDEIMVYLINHGVPDFDSFTIMEKVRKGKGLTPEHEALMREHDVPEWYIESCKKIKYMFPKGHAVAYVTNTFRIGYFKIHFPYAFYAATFSVKLEDFDYMVQCFGVEKVKDKLKELRAKGNDASAKEKNIITVCELTREMYVRGFKFVEIDIYKSDVRKFKIAKDEDGNELGLLPPLCAIQGFGETAAQSLVKAREDGVFHTLEEMSARTGIGKKTIESLKECGVLKGIPDTNQLSLFN